MSKGNAITFRNNVHQHTQSHHPHLKTAWKTFQLEAWISWDHVSEQLFLIQKNINCTFRDTKLAENQSLIYKRSDISISQLCLPISGSVNGQGAKTHVPSKEQHEIVLRGFFRYRHSADTSATHSDLQILWAFFFQDYHFCVPPSQQLSERATTLRQAPDFRRQALRAQKQWALSAGWDRTNPVLGVELPGVKGRQGSRRLNEASVTITCK